MIDIIIYKDNYLRVISLLNNLNINIYNIKQNPLILKIKYKDYNKVKKYFNCKIISYYGLLKIKNIININNLFLIITILNIYFLSNIILSINIIHSKEEIRNIINNELKNYNLKRLTIKKDYQELNQIKEKILENNKDKIEWLEIKNIGMSYQINVEERIINETKSNNDYCHIIATKEAQITRYNAIDGEILIEKNKLVRKGDILISGSIHLNDEIISNTCAKGYVYGTTWYQMNIRIPRNKLIKEDTNKYRYNLLFKNKTKETLIFKNRLDSYTSTKKKIISFFNKKLYLVKDQEYKEKYELYTDEEISQLIDIQVKEKINNLIKEKYTIINQNTLKKTINDSMIDIELFIVVEELISTTTNYIIE